MTENKKLIDEFTKVFSLIENLYLRNKIVCITFPYKLNILLIALLMKLNILKEKFIFT